MPPSSAAASLERVNLNLPPPERAKLRSLAKTAGKPEAVYARDLLLEAIARAAESDFQRRLAASRTPAYLAREREIVLAMEKLRHG